MATKAKASPTLPDPASLPAYDPHGLDAKHRELAGRVTSAERAAQEHKVEAQRLRALLAEVDGGDPTPTLAALEAAERGERQSRELAAAATQALHRFEADTEAQRVAQVKALGAEYHTALKACAGEMLRHLDELVQWTVTAEALSRRWDRESGRGMSPGKTPRQVGIRVGRPLEDGRELVRALLNPDALARWRLALRSEALVTETTLRDTETGLQLLRDANQARHALGRPLLSAQQRAFHEREARDAAGKAKLDREQRDANKAHNRARERVRFEDGLEAAAQAWEGLIKKMKGAA